MVKSFLAFVILFFVTWSSGGQQMLDFKDITELPATVNSNAEEMMPLLSADGKTLYFSRVMSSDNEGGVFAGQDIWASNAEGTIKASNRISLNNKSHNAVVGVNRDGKTIYLIDASRSQKMNGIYLSRQNSGKWSKPELVPIPGIANLDFIGFYVSPDFDVIFLSMKAPDSRGEEDLYYSVKDVAGSWSIPKNLGATINTSGFEISPFLSADKKRLYFSSNGLGGEGDADIFYSDKLYESWETWSVPVNLGTPVNSKKFDAYFSIYGDTVAYLSSNRDSKYADLFRINIKKVKTILRARQHYFTAAEWAEIIGKNVSGKIAFPHNSDVLTAAQKELIFFIVNKVMLDRDIEIHLVVREEEDAKYSKTRADQMVTHLKKLGIDESRIHTDAIFIPEKSQRGVIEILLLK